MESLQHLINETKRNSLEISYTYRVYVTHINNPHSFYVRFRDYNQYMPTVQARGDHINKSEIKVGVVVIFKSKIAKDYVRGKIIFIEGEDDITCDLFALDIGCVENCVPLRKMWKPYHQVNLPALAFHCQLGNCSPRDDRWHAATIEAMRGFVQGKVARIKIKNIMSEVVIVEVSIKHPDDLATLLAITRHTSFNYMDDLDYQFAICCNIYNNFYPERILQVKSVLRVRMQSGSFLDKFYAAQVDEYNLYLEERNEYTAYAESEKPVELKQLKLNAPVGVYYNQTKKYERGIVRGLFPKKNRAKVELIDWGKMIEESVNIMRPVPDRFMSNPAIAIFCALHISQYSMMRLTEISNLANISYPGVEFFIKIEETAIDENSPNLITVFGIKT